MRILCMHKASPRDEAGMLPPPELIQGMGELIGEAARRGILLGGEGLKPSSSRWRLTFAEGRCEVTKGPFRGDNELPQRMVILRSPTSRRRSNGRGASAQPSGRRGSNSVR